MVMDFVLLGPCVCFRIFSNVWVTEWPPIGKMAANSACNMFSYCGCLIVNLVFSHLGFWSGNFFLIAPFSDHCLRLLFFSIGTVYHLASNH